MIREVRSRPLADIRRKIDTKPAGDNRKERSKAVEAAAGNKDRAGSNILEIQWENQNRNLQRHPR